MRCSLINIPATTYFTIGYAALPGGKLVGKTGSSGENREAVEKEDFVMWTTEFS
jgi:hypothetical protein